MRRSACLGFYVWSVTTAASEKSCCRWTGDLKGPEKQFYVLLFTEERGVHVAGSSFHHSGLHYWTFDSSFSCQPLFKPKISYTFLFGSIHNLCLCLNSARGKEKREWIRWVGREWMPGKQRPSGVSRCCPRTHAAFPSVTSHPWRGGFPHMFFSLSAKRSYTRRRRL